MMFLMQHQHHVKGLLALQRYHISIFKIIGGFMLIVNSKTFNLSNLAKFSNQIEDYIYVLKSALDTNSFIQLNPI